MSLAKMDILTEESAERPALVCKISWPWRYARRLQHSPPPYSTCLKRAFVIFCRAAKPSRQEEIFVTT